MAGLVEFVPNFSEGRDAARVGKIVDAMAAVPGVRVLDKSMDPGHHRSVVTILGSAEAVGEAAFRGVREAAKLIDLRSHRGQHPRMGAADVVPFVPLRGTEMADCVALARRVGERIGRELSIPVFLYEEAATRTERRNLADLRKPQFEGLRRLVGSDPAWQPDFGPNALHPSAGAVAVGARPLLVAYNVYLSSSNPAVAKAIARAVRHQTGGLRYVKALGLGPDEAGRVQVSMNLTNTAASPMHRALEMIRSEAARYGVSVVETELVGLVSADALLEAAEHYLQLNSLSRSQVLEYRLLEETSSPLPPGDGPRLSPLPLAESPRLSPLPLGEGQGEGSSGTSQTSSEHDLLNATVAGFSEQVASRSPLPGGGSVAALMGALASSLVVMVSRLTLGRKRFSSVETRMQELEGRAEALRTRLLELVEADAEAYRGYMEAARKAKAGDGDGTALARAALGAAQVPLESARASLEAGELALEVARLGNPVARDDARVAALAAHAAVLGAAINVRANLPSLSPEQKPEEMEAEASRLEQRAGALLRRLATA